MKPLDRVSPYGQPSAATRKRVEFKFDGKSYFGFEGDTLAAALLANGIDIVGRSFKLHRPRGVMGSGVEESNALVQLESDGFEEPNVRSTVTPLYQGLKAASQNAWPNAQWDVLGVMDRFQRFLPASFYYKSMMWPNWHFYERIVRPIAGLGKAPKVRDAQKYQKRNAHCDVLVVGGGPAGLMAALVAGKAGLRVILADDREDFGGALLAERFKIDGAPAVQWVQRCIAELSALKTVQLLPRTNVSGYYENNVIVAAERVSNHLGTAQQAGRLRERLWRIRANSVVLSTGAIERPLVFANNDRPGVMLASAVRMYVNRFGVIPGRQVVIVANHDDAYRTAFDLHAAGAKVITVVDTRRKLSTQLTQRVSDAGFKHYVGYGIRDVVGKARVKGVKISSHESNGKLGDDVAWLSCDLLAMSSGWTPTVHLYSQAGGSLRFNEAAACLVPDTCKQRVWIVGAANGNFSLNGCLSEGVRAAEEVVRGVDSSFSTDVQVPKTHAAEAESLNLEPFWFTQNTRTDKQWLDFQYDVKVSDIELALRENFRSVEHVKRYTTGGMSVDQGKSSNFNILAIMAELSGQPIVRVGTTRFRPPYQPVTLGTFAGGQVGELYSPWQSLPATANHEARGARLGDYGWRRPDYYPQRNEDILAATRREVLAVRNGVGMFDGSPLGKIEVRGPDAATFLNRVYVNNLASLKPGFARYALLTNENGVLIDDGVIVRIEEQHFVVHATSGAASRVAMLFEEYLQCEWSGLRVHVNNVTTQWANVTVSGPKARAVLESMESDIDFSADSFRHMQFKSGTAAGVEARILRASFTGEVTYEISVPSRYGAALWEHVSKIGEPFGITPYGIEALEVMRIEKGYLHVGVDTDACSNPHDIGFAKIIEKKIGDFIGRRSLQRPADHDKDRLEFVGLESVETLIPLPIGGHFIDSGRPTFPATSNGYVTSACMSPNLGKAIGLGILRNGASRLGEQVNIYSNGRVIAARVVSPAHFDPKGERLNG